MLDEKIIQAIEWHESLADSSDLSNDREELLDYYYGNPMGNEVPGRSQVVSRQVWDTVEWLKPQLADIFTAGDEVVSFSAKGPEDVKQSEQETDYVNYIITQKNNWFELFYSWMHDALVQKVGYVKAYWDDSEDITIESYNNLTDAEYSVLMQAQDVEIVEHEEVVIANDMTMQIERMHSVKLQRKKPRNTVKIENLEPNNVLVDHNATKTSLQDCNFVEHREYKTISELRLEGFDVDDDISDYGANDYSMEETDEYQPFKETDDYVDPSMRRVLVRECWIRIDADEDGVAELRHVVVVGTTILHNEDCDIIPIVSLCPIPLPHQHVGYSVADAVMDLQKIGTALLRGALDNQYLANNGRYGVNVDLVNMDDMLDSRPGGIVRVNGEPGANIFPLTHPTNGAQVIPMMEYLDKVGQKRTGVSEMAMGIDPNALNNNAGANANSMAMTAAQQRIRFIARIFAETGVKTLFQIVHALTLKNSRQATMIELRGQWIPVDPRQWVKRTDMRISAGLGLGDKPQQLAFLDRILQLQMGVGQTGVTNPSLIYNTLTRLTKLAGYKDTSEFWQNPAQLPPAPPAPPPPQILVEQMRIQADAQKAQFEMQAKLKEMEIQMQAKMAELDATLKLQATNDMRDSAREEQKMQIDAQIKAAEQESKKQIELLKAEVEKYKADLSSQTQIFIKQMELGMKSEKMEPPEMESEYDDMEKENGES